MINRREAFRLGGGATLVALAVSSMPTPAVAGQSPELTKLIEAHRAAFAAMYAYCDVAADAERAFFRDRSNKEARLSKDRAHEIQSDLHDTEKAAFLALLSYPISTLDELRTIVAVGQKTWWDDDSPDGDEAEALIAGIMGNSPEASPQTG